MNISPQTPPTALYIHIPWCVKKCPYCDFNSHPKNHGYQETEYTNSLIKDIRAFATEHNPVSLQSIFFGGGTPSLFSGKSIDRILNATHKYFHVHDTAEISLESNPGTYDCGNYREYFQSGINRLSIGAQSFSDSALAKLGRIHSANEIREATMAAFDSGFTNINLDLMYGLPGQSVALATNDLYEAIKLSVTHISWYQLTLEPNTHFYQQPPILPADDLLAEISLQGLKILENNGYKRYEISAYARDDLQCQHNINYWRYGDYIGLGAGAHSKLSVIEPWAIVRQQRLKHPKDYMQHSGTHQVYTETRIENPKEIIFEFLMNNFRLDKVVSFIDFSRLTGLSHKALLEASTGAIKNELVKINKNSLELTQTGKRFLNNTLLSYMPDPAI